MMPDNAMPQPLARHAVAVFSGAGGAATAPTTQDWLAAEVPVALVFNGISHAVMMATPQDLDMFALGFALSEGIVESASDVRAIDVALADLQLAGLPPGIDAMEVNIEISTRSFEQLKSHRRTLAGRTGCGVCGVESLAALDLFSPPIAWQEWVSGVDAPTVLNAFAQLAPLQVLNADSGALHAAAWATLDGNVLHAFEDVGRHNALDKVIGKLAKTGQLGTPGFVILSSRASHELVRKCARVGVAAMATISAPTSMAVHMAELNGVRLWGLCRAPRAVLYWAGNGLGK
jgi:FdhD protein